MDELMQKSAGNEAMTKRLQTMLVIALQSGTPRAFENAFHFLKSPDENLQNFAAQAIFARLLEYGKQGQFYDRLGSVQSRYASDPELQLFVERFALMQAAGGARLGYDAAKARALLDKSLDIAAAWDKSRGPFLAQAAAAARQAQAQGQKAQVPDLPSLTALEIQMLGEAAAAQGAPQSLKDLAKTEVNRTATLLIQDAESRIPGLHEKLIADGVVLPDTDNGYGGYSEYEGYGYGGYSGVSKHYRELYKLRHLRLLQEDLQAKAAEIQSNAVDAPEFIELMDRAGKVLPAMQEAGKAAGMLDGDTVAEKAADSVNPVLAEGVSKFSGSGFIRGLRAQGLAPDNGATSGEALYNEAYTLEQMRGVRAYLYGLALSGNGFNYDGTPRPLTVEERKYLAGALDSMARLEAQFYNAPPPQDEAVPPALAIGKISARAEKAAGKGAEERALMTELLATLRTPAGAQATVEELNDALETLFKGAPDAADRKVMLRELSAALDGKAAGAPLAAAAQKRLKDQFTKLETQLNEAFPGFNAKAAQAGARSSEYLDYATLKLSHIRRLEGVVNAAELEAKTKGALDDKQKAAVAAARALIPALIEAGPKAGLLPGDTPGERVADAVNPKLYANYLKFYGTMFRLELVNHGLAPNNGESSVDTGYSQSYSKADLQKLLAFLEDFRKSGNGWENETTRRPFTDDEKTVLDAAIETVREQLAHYPGDKTTLRGAALLGLAPLALVLGTWQIFLAMGAVGLAVWLYTRWTGDSDEGVEGPAERKTGPAPDAARRARRVELAAKKLASSVAGGSFRSLFIGAGGSDFAESRPYAGEDRRDMDWKATAKMGEPYAKKYELEKDMPLVLVVDVSGSGAFGTRGEEKRQVIEDVSSVLALAAAQLNLRVGAVLVSDKVEAYIPPKNGAQQAHEIIRRLQAQSDEPRKTDLRPALDFALKSIRSRAVVAVVSDFLAPDFRSSISSLAQRHDVRAIRVSDPAELGPMPDVGLLSVRDGETGELRDVDTSNAEFRAEHAALIERREGRLADAFSQARLRPLTLSTEGDYLQELQDAFDPKAQPTRSQK
jgi:uncharacterized protein (DUF58 family)